MKDKPINPNLPPPYNTMTAKDFERETAQFDGPLNWSKTRAMTPAERTRHAAAKRRGRPRVGQGAEKIRISMERDLLAKADAFAAKRKQSRSQLIAEALTSLLGRKAG